MMLSALIVPFLAEFGKVCAKSPTGPTEAAFFTIMCSYAMIVEVLIDRFHSMILEGICEVSGLIDQTSRYSLRSRTPTH